VRARDLLIVGAVALLVGFAVFDAIRGDDGDEAGGMRPRSVTAPTETAATEPMPEPEPLPRGVLGGSLVFAEVALEGPLACPLRLVYLATGEEGRFPQDTLGCSVSAPRRGSAVAKSIGDELTPTNELRYRIIDPDHAERPFHEVWARDGRLSWTLDGGRVLWCLGPGGRELELGRMFHSFRKCANGYTADGERFYLRGRRLVVGDRLVLERPAAIDEAVWSTNGSVALVVGGRRLERWDDGGLDGVAVLPEGFAFSPTYFSPDNCAAIVLAPTQEVYLIDLGCFRGRDPSAIESGPCGRRVSRIVRCFPWFRPSSFFGHNANLGTWSPDGNWIAVVEADAIVFHRVVGQYASVRWGVRAATLAWR
jgi:hypothetical protein